MKRNGAWYFRWWVEKKDRWIKTYAATKPLAEKLERECRTALDANNFRFLSPEAREILVRFHKNMGWIIPGTLIRVEQEDDEDIILWNEENPKKGAVQIFFNSKIIRNKPKSTLDRYSQCIAHFIRIMKPNKVMKTIWTSDLHEYYSKRVDDEKASPNTVGWEISTLSGIFGILIDNKKITGITENPCNLVRGKQRGLNFKSKRRSAYLGNDVLQILMTTTNPKTQTKIIPDWLIPIILTGLYTGMRRDEILTLKREDIFLDKRIIFLKPMIPKEDKIKKIEGESKKIPIHRDLIPILEQALRVPSIGCENLFLISDDKGTRPVSIEATKSAMRRAVDFLKPDPRFRFHDLRHTFKRNCSISGISDRIAERILGHSDKHGILDGYVPVSHRYGIVTEKELVQAIDRYTVDHGESRIHGRPVILRYRSSFVAENEKQDDLKVGHPAN